MKLLIAFILSFIAVVALAGEPRLVVREYPLDVEPGVIPGVGPEFAEAVDSVCERHKLAKNVALKLETERMPPRNWRTNRAWDVREGVEAPGEGGDSVGRAMVRFERRAPSVADTVRVDLSPMVMDTAPNRDRDGRLFFNLIEPAPREAWSVRTADGVRWTLTHTASRSDVIDQKDPRASWERYIDSLAVVDSAYARLARTWDQDYTLARDDSVVQRFTTSSVEPEGLVTAFAWGDSAIVEYIAPGRIHHVIVNGEDLNLQWGWDDCFGLEILAGRPFCFFSRDGGYGWFYDGQEFAEGYEQIIHDFCCDAGVLNPAVFPDYLRAYAQRGETWYLLDGRVEEK